MKLQILVSLFLLNTSIFAQSSSVMDVTYFNRNETEAPVRVGKGFDIRDVFKQTRNCFTKETSSPTLLKATQQSQKTSITLHYTKSDEEYNLLRKSSSEGKISHLNLFSAGGSLLTEFTSRVHKVQERLIFVAKVDFGSYEFESEPKFTTDAENLIAQKKFKEFINFYGTHYISGIRKESSVWIVLTKQNSENEETNTSSKEASGSMPVIGLGGNFQVSNRNDFSKLVKNGSYDVEVVINGPSLESSDIIDGVRSVLSNEEEKVAGIERIARSAIGKISVPTQAAISKYYYTPFSLLGVEGINWDKAKEQELTNINEQVLKVFTANNDIDTIIENKGMMYPFSSMNIGDVSDAKPYVKQKIEEYNRNVDIKVKKISTYKSSLDTTLTFLERAYKNCSDIDCSPSQNCCKNVQSLNTIKEQVKQVNMSIKELENVHMKFLEGLLDDAATCNCQKREIGTIVITNMSTNPYDIFVKNKFIKTIPGRETDKIECIEVGEDITLKAVQKSGYLMYPTTNIRNFRIGRTCQEIPIKIGFED